MNREVFVVLSKVGSERRQYWVLELASVGPLGRDVCHVAGNAKREKIEPLARIIARVLGVQLVRGFVQGRSTWETIAAEVGP